MDTHHPTQPQEEIGRTGSASALSARDSGRLVPCVRNNFCSGRIADRPIGLWVSVLSLNMRQSSSKQNLALESLRVPLKSRSLNLFDSQALQK